MDIFPEDNEHASADLSGLFFFILFFASILASDFIFLVFLITQMRDSTSKCVCNDCKVQS